MTPSGVIVHVHEVSSYRGIRGRPTAGEQIEPETPSARHHSKAYPGLLLSVGHQGDGLAS